MKENSMTYSEIIETLFFPRLFDQSEWSSTFRTLHVNRELVFPWVGSCVPQGVLLSCTWGQPSSQWVASSGYGSFADSCRSSPKLDSASQTSLWHCLALGTAETSSQARGEQCLCSGTLNSWADSQNTHSVCLADSLHLFCSCFSLTDRAWKSTLEGHWHDLSWHYKNTK